MNDDSIFVTDSNYNASVKGDRDLEQLMEDVFKVSPFEKDDTPKDDIDAALGMLQRTSAPKEDVTDDEIEQMKKKLL